MAIIVLIGLLYYVQKRIPNLIETADLPYFIGIFMAVVLSGILISFFSTFFAVRKYLKLKLDDLY
jgi:cell division transport system permease protein